MDQQQDVSEYYDIDGLTSVYNINASKESTQQSIDNLTSTDITNTAPTINAYDLSSGFQADSDFEDELLRDNNAFYHNMHKTSATHQTTHKTPLQDEPMTLSDRLISGVFGGGVFGIAGLLIDLTVSIVRAIAGVGLGDIIWLFAPFLLVIGFVIGFMNTPDNQLFNQDKTDDSSSGGMVRLIAMIVMPCAILWMIFILMV